MAAAAMMAGGLLGAVGSIFGGISAYQSGKAQKEASKQAAVRAEAEGQNKARLIRAQARRMAGAQRAHFASAGTDLSGTALDIQFDSANQFGADAMSAIYSGNQQAADLRTQGNFAYTSGRNSLISSIFSAAGSVLGGAGQAASYNSLKTNPSFSSGADNTYGGGWSLGPRSNIGR